ncbi:MAG: hypothetical protein NT166_20020 [Candidatus Aminicenantes bacterium]|nr:hypothetical protein [Candidatus Aminicenantes bacterium]
MSMDIPVDFIRKVDRLQPDLRDILYSMLDVIDRHRLESVNRDDFNELKGIVKDLVVSQKELAEAQKRTEEEIRGLARDHKNTQKEVGGLSTTFGYMLENAAYKKLPGLLARDFGIIIKGALKRDYLIDEEGAEIEVNIFGYGEKEGREITIVGESKAQLSQNDVDKFLRKKYDRMEGVFKEMFPVLITHMITSGGVGTYVKNKGIALYYSYDF